MHNIHYTTNRRHWRQRGFTLFVAIVVTGTLLVIASGITNLAVRQSFISTSARESQHAFYAADSGIECALYWDVKNPAGYSAFSTSTGSLIFCNQDGANNPNPTPAVVGGNYQSTFTLTFLPDPYCAVVTVIKDDNNTTSIESKGYNTCAGANGRRVERAVRVTY